MPIPFITGIDSAEQQAWLSVLRQAMPDFNICLLDDLAVEQRAKVEVAIVANPDPAELAVLPKLKWIQSLWAGVERLVKDVSDPSIQIVRLVDPNLADTMAEAVLSWVLYLHRDMPRYHQQQLNSEWLQHDVRMAKDRAVGLLGMGKLGQMAARRLVANGFSVSGWSRSGGNFSGVTMYHGDEGLTQLLQSSNILVLLLPLTDETRHLLDKQRLGQLPINASLINFGRGPLLVEKDLLDALDSGRLQHAVLDVFDQEPLPQSHPFWHHRSITVLPHIAAPTNKQTASVIVADNIRAFLETGSIPEGVNRSRGY